MSKHAEMQRLIRYYKDETGVKEVDMHKVARFAVSKGWPLPEPRDPLDRLARQFAAAAREEIRHDKATGRPYRANHVYTVQQGDLFQRLWVDIDEVARAPMLASLVNRREQMVGDACQLSFDAEHWSRVNPDKEPINLPMDFTQDVEWRRNAPGDEEEKAS